MYLSVCPCPAPERMTANAKFHLDCFSRRALACHWPAATLYPPATVFPTAGHTWRAHISYLSGHAAHLMLFPGHCQPRHVAVTGTLELEALAVCSSTGARLVVHHACKRSHSSLFNCDRYRPGIISCFASSMSLETLAEDFWRVGAILASARVFKRHPRYMPPLYAGNAIHCIRLRPPICNKAVQTNSAHLVHTVRFAAPHSERSEATGQGSTSATTSDTNRSRMPLLPSIQVNYLSSTFYHGFRWFCSASMSL